jgi:hypothetical protein
MVKSVEDSDVTYGGLAKLVLAVSFLVAQSIALYAWVSSLKTEFKMHEQRNEIFEKSVTEQIKQLQDGQAANQKAVTDLTNTLTRTNTILEQMSKKGN